MPLRSLYLLLCPLLAAVLLWLPPAHADAPHRYDVEIIVFSQDGDADGEQLAVPDTGTLRARGAFPTGEFTKLPPDAYTLTRIRNGLAAAHGYHVLLYRAWRQAAYDRQHAVDYPVQSMSGSGDSVEGTVTLVRERFLHLDIDLLLHAASTGPASAPDGTGSPVYRLTENRRIRSDEIQYFDHPRFGVIARVTPVTGTEAPDAPAAPDNAPAEDDTPVTEDEPAPAQAPAAQ
jgi:hypothetical protein